MKKMLKDKLNKELEAVNLEAVKRNGYALKFVKEQTYDICLEAVKQNGCALEFVEEKYSKKLLNLKV